MNKKEFIQLLDKYLAGSASPEEEELLLRVYETYQDNQEWDSHELDRIDALEDKLFERIKLAMHTPETAVDGAGRVPAEARRLPLRRILIAASVILIAGVGMLFLLRPRPAGAPVAETPAPGPKQDFSPGGNNAYLVLSDGQKLALNQAKVGLLAQQGSHAVIKKEDGQIVYSPVGADVPVTRSIALNKIVVPVGGQYRVMLPDGTHVWLNAASSLEYPVEFTGDRRQVKLTGEAYFEVARNTAMPFIVNVNDKMDVNVLGTHFNIMAYDDEEKIATTLLEGAVKVVDRAHPGNVKTLTPGQQANRAENGGIDVTDVDTEEAIAWKDGQFLFVNEDIHSIMRKLARWYDVKVEYSRSLKNKSFDGSISRNRNISEVLKLMELTKSVHFTYGERKITVMP
ncbi:MAG TPA: FecR domain-containing protein [Puia sp.]|nr:FecR domain-containing protein [Puia sp.]